MIGYPTHYLRQFLPIIQKNNYIKQKKLIVMISFFDWFNYLIKIALTGAASTFVTFKGKQ